MVAATVTERLEGTAGEEIVILTVSDGETFTTKLSNPIGAIFTWAEDTTGSTLPDYTLSGRTFTINSTAAADTKLMVQVKGRL